MAQISCPRCGSQNITFQREQTGNIGAGTNKVVIQTEKGHSCLYWLLIGWWWKLIYFLMIGWWWNLLFKRHSLGGINVRANKAINHTVAICQNCGNSWKVN